ncbi:regulatory protein, luxR family [Blastococcus haudaquaticus]|uniref:Regulatory protein, luxR family n=1 Tax=Blastococcus haudaquaticus TaxID=1938745 RepID=A0A286GT98_9ACTN|nr:regulatory protein, luxR family [Blastococcus haudaquaticus]
MLDRLVDGLHAGRSSVLVLRGEPGIGKSALLDHVAERAAECRIARVGGVESEMEIAFAGLHQLCAPMLARLERLPAPQRDALRSVFGLRDRETAPDRFVVGLAVLTLLSDAAAEKPLICLVDDAQWLDRASVQAMAFAARRLLADPVAMVFAVREPSDEHQLDGLPGMVLQGIGEDDARMLLASALPGPLDPRVRDRIVAEARGNPLALLEVPRGWAPTELAGGFGVTDAGHLTGRIEQSFVRRLDPLPADTRRLLLAAAAEPLGDAGLLWRAAARLGIGTDAAAPAVADGLIDIGVRVRFRHPLVRSAIYRTAPAHERHAVHGALADATDREADPDRWTWHRAHAAGAPDEAVAEELERSAARAQRRGGLAAAAAFLECATELTPDPRRRVRRALMAAQATFDAGSPDSASELLAVAEIGPLLELDRARLERLRAVILFAKARGNDAVLPLLEAGRRLVPLDADLARETFLEACSAVVFSGRLAPAGRGREVAEAARSAPPGERPMDLWLMAMATWFAEGDAASAALMRNALDAFRRDDIGEADHRWLWIASRGAPTVWDDDAWHDLARRQVRVAREAGALTLLAVALACLADEQVHEGDFAGAAASLDEVDVITEVTGNAPIIHTALILSAWRGEVDQASEVFRTAVRAATDRGEGRAITLVELATAVLENGLGRYDAALAAAQRACRHDEIILANWALVELIEAAVRSGHRDVAVEALGRLVARIGSNGTEWALGIEARCRALVCEGPDAEALYRDAVERLSGSRAAPQLGRAHLLYGEWLRRENRRVEARDQLRRADDLFSGMGARAFAERAGRELLATGATVHRRDAGSLEELTAQEAQIARLAVEGLTNPEIGAQLYLSRRTVEWHLRKVFTKLGISSRRELEKALP